MTVELRNPYYGRTGDAAADLTGKEGRVVVRNTSGQWALAGANAGGYRGILTEAGKAGEGVGVDVGGLVRAVAGGTFSAGVSLTTDANAAVVLATTGQNAIGYADVGGAAGKIVGVEVRPHVAL